MISPCWLDLWRMKYKWVQQAMVLWAIAGQASQADTECLSWSWVGCLCRQARESQLITTLFISDASIEETDYFKPCVHTSLSVFAFMPCLCSQGLSPCLYNSKTNFYANILAGPVSADNLVFSHLLYWMYRGPAMDLNGKVQRWRKALADEGIDQYWQLCLSKISADRSQQR